MSKSTSRKTNLTISTGENYIIRNAESSFREKFIFHGSMSKVCTKCKIEKPVNHYHWKMGKTRLQSECSGCRKKVDRSYKCSTPESYVTYLARGLTYEYKKRKRRRESKLTAEEIVELWKKQRSKFGLRCPYSGVEMSYALGNGFQDTNISIDRFDSKKSYERGNVVFCCWFVNRMKFTYGYSRFLEVCERIVAEKDRLPQVVQYLMKDDG